MGWAQTSKSNRTAWSRMIHGYLLHRTTVVLIGVLIDIRLPPQAIDLSCISWLAYKELPFAILLTKADKLSSQQVHRQLTVFQQTFTEKQYNPLSYCVTSSRKGLGKDCVLSLIEKQSEIALGDSSFHG